MTKTNGAHRYHKSRAKTAHLLNPAKAESHAKAAGGHKLSSSATWQHHRGPELDINIPTDAESVIRKDYFNESYVIIAPKRHLRPNDQASSEHGLIETASSPRLDLQEEVDSIRDRSGNWKTMVVENKYPALTLKNPQAFGKQEIVIDTPLPNTPLGKLSRDELLTVLQTYQKRTTELMKIKGIKYVTVFKNDGLRAGASLAHAHSQIFATPMIPSAVLRTSQAVEKYFQKTKKVPYDSVLAYETAEKSRIIAENELFLSFCPFAPRWPLEAWIVPKKHVTDVRRFNSGELRLLAEALHPLLSRLTRYKIDYNFYLENGVSPNHRFNLKLEPRSLAVWGGFEAATDMILNPIPPESAALWYRKNK